MRPFFALLTTFLLLHMPAQAWWENGHRTTARLAAYYLTPEARARVAKILNVADDQQTVADALAAASTWADEIKKDRPETQSWHYIDLALQDKRSDIPERCADQNCVTARTSLFSQQLIEHKALPDPASDLDSLRFLVHFVGDLHQPLHNISDADLGGNCEPLTEDYHQAKNLHALWDGPMVDVLNPDDKLLAAELKGELNRMGKGERNKMAEGSIDEWSWQSHRLAEEEIYHRLKIPKEPVEFPPNCNGAPEEIRNDKITVESDYVEAMKPVIKLQLERAGLRLARLLNEL